MNQAAIALIAILAIIAAAEGIWILLRTRRSQHLRGKFGPEYDRSVREHGNQWRAESELEAREKRVAKFHIRRLNPDERERFAEEWHRDEALFVDDPEGAVTHADQLVREVMKTRGYPMSDIKQSIEDVSVEHSRVVENYRAAAEIAERHKRGAASTEDLRKAMVYYRTLFDDLLEMQEVRR